VWACANWGHPKIAEHDRNLKLIFTSRMTKWPKIVSFRNHSSAEIIMTTKKQSPKLLVDSQWNLGKLENISLIWDRAIVVQLFLMSITHAFFPIIFPRICPKVPP
jgi:hypothetical protein